MNITGHKIVKTKREWYPATNKYLHEIVGSKDVVDARHGGVGEVLVHDGVKTVRLPLL